MEITPEQFDQLKQEKVFKGRIVTDSMVPVIPVGELIEAQIGEMNLERFDIIVFYSQGRLNCHYIWNLNRVVRPILLQSRNLRGEKDTPISMEHYLGKLSSHKLSLYWKLRILFQFFPK